MCVQCNLEMPDRAEVFRWLEAFPVPSLEQAGIAGRLAAHVKYELLAVWRAEEEFDVRQAVFDLQRLMCILGGFQQTLQPLQQMQMQAARAKAAPMASAAGHNLTQ
jgi:hypothetical protein